MAVSRCPAAAEKGWETWWRGTYRKRGANGWVAAGSALGPAGGRCELRTRQLLCQRLRGHRHHGAPLEFKNLHVGYLGTVEPSPLFVDDQKFSGRVLLSVKLGGAPGVGEHRAFVTVVGAAEL